MAISYREHLRRCLMIEGAFFDPHVIERAQERIGIQDFDEKRYQQKVVDLEGDLYYDREYENYQIALEELVFAFNLRFHDERPGLMAYVKTALPTETHFREKEDRFRLLDPRDYELCEKCELALKKIVENGLRDVQRKAVEGDS